MTKLNRNWLLEHFGATRAPDGELVRERFAQWFGASQVVDTEGRPLVVHHGTGNSASILSGGFSYEFTGQGNDALGPGWYFTNKLDTAQGYTTHRLEPELQKLGGEHSPGILDVYLRLENPICTTSDGHWYEQLPDLSARHAKELILASPYIHDPDDVISNWGDVRAEGFDRVINRAAQAYVGPSDFTVFNDFFRGATEKFMRKLHELTGHDGVIHRFNNLDEVHYVAWFPEAIKSATSNPGLYDLRCPDITDRTSELLVQARQARALSAQQAQRLVSQLPTGAQPQLLKP